MAMHEKILFTILSEFIIHAMNVEYTKARSNQRKSGSLFSLVGVRASHHPLLQPQLIA